MFFLSFKIYSKTLDLDPKPKSWIRMQIQCFWIHNAAEVGITIRKDRDTIVCIPVAGDDSSLPDDTVDGGEDSEK